MKLFPGALKNNITNIFNSSLNEVGKYITIYGEPDKTDCPNCLSDNTGKSTGVFDSSFVAPVEIYGETYTPQSFNRGRCPVCFGEGYLTQDQSTGIKALIKWNPNDGETENTPGGLEGQNIVLVKTAKCYYEIIRDCKKAEVDGVECILERPPVYGSVGDGDVMVIAYFITKKEGNDVRDYG